MTCHCNVFCMSCPGGSGGIVSSRLFVVFTLPCLFFFFFFFLSRPTWRLFLPSCKVHYWLVGGKVARPCPENKQNNPTPHPPKKEEEKMTRGVGGGGGGGLIQAKRIWTWVCFHMNSPTKTQNNKFGVVATACRMSTAFSPQKVPQKLHCETVSAEISGAVMSELEKCNWTHFTLCTYWLFSLLKPCVLLSLWTAIVCIVDA